MTFVSSCAQVFNTIRNKSFIFSVSRHVVKCSVKMAALVQILICIAAVIVYCHAATILALFSTLSYADHLIFRGYVELLAKRQHRIVVMTPYTGQFQYPDVEYITEIDVSAASIPFYEKYKKLVSKTADYLSILPELNELNVRLAVAQIRSQQMSSLMINPDVKFDLVVTEADMPLLYGFAEKYRAPHVSITASHGKINMYDSKGNPNHPLLYPDVFALDYGNLSIWKKMREVARHLRFKYEYYHRLLPACQEVAEKIFDLKRELQEVEYDIDLLLVSGTHMLIGNRPTVPAIVYVDRLHIKPGLAIPQDLMSVLGALKDGFVYFSLGWTQESDSLPACTVQALLTALGELPTAVLWKLHNTTGLSVPNNVVTRKWFPQQELLAHPNIRAFITHGGPRSLEESIFYEVPIVVVPVTSGAKVFARQITKFGAGRIVDPDYIQEQLKIAVHDVINNSMYKQSMSKLNYLAFDQPLSGPERAVWWTEYVLRHGGAKHLRAPAVGVPVYKYFMLDVLAILLALLGTCAAVAYVLVKRLMSSRGTSRPDGKWKML